MSGKMPPEPLVPYPDCGFCKDKGLTFDEFNHYRFCGCRCGLALAQQEPYAVVEANEAYVKVMAIGARR